MKLSKSDLPLLRWSILVFCASALISTAVFYVSSTYIANSQKDLRKARSMRSDARKRLAAAHEDRDNMSIYSSEYGVLLNRKIIGDDQRLDWIEGMEKLRQMNLVTDFSYQIAPQIIYSPQPPISAGDFNINYSETKLHFNLLHELQLVDFFTALPKTIQGWYQLEGCKLMRSSVADENVAMSSGVLLTADCTGGWITLKNRNAKP